MKNTGENTPEAQNISGLLTAMKNAASPPHELPQNAVLFLPVFTGNLSSMTGHGNQFSKLTK